jgi:hypothetical protein
MQRELGLGISESHGTVRPEVTLTHRLQSFADKSVSQF